MPAFPAGATLEEVSVDARQRMEALRGAAFWARVVGWRKGSSGGGNEEVERRLIMAKKRRVELFRVVSGGLVISVQRHGDADEGERA